MSHLKSARRILPALTLFASYAIDAYGRSSASILHPSTRHEGKTMSFLSGIVLHSLAGSLGSHIITPRSTVRGQHHRSTALHHLHRELRCHALSADEGRLYPFRMGWRPSQWRRRWTHRCAIATRPYHLQAHRPHDHAGHERWPLSRLRSRHLSAIQQWIRVHRQDRQECAAGHPDYRYPTLAVR